MRRTMLILIGMMIPFASAFTQYGYEPGVILLKLRNPDVVTLLGNRVINGSPEFQSALDKYNPIDSYKLPHAGPHAYGWYHIDFPKDAPVEEIRKVLSTCRDISDVTLNFYGTYSEAPNDTHWNDQWALQKIQMEETWDYVKPDNEILVGIIDSGLDRYHDDLSDNIWTNPDEILNGKDDDGNGHVDDTWGWDFAFNDRNPMEDEFDDVHNYHGTRVAGVVAARTYNALGVAGVAGGWQGQTGVRLIGLRIFGVDPFGQPVFRLRDAGDAIVYLTKLRQRGYTVIANMSFQLPKKTDDDYGYFKDQVEDAEYEGVIMVAAAGNIKDKSDYEQQDANPNLPAPARWDGVLAIGASKDGATLDDEEKASYSLYDTQTRKLLAVAPVVGSSMNVYTTYKNDDYINSFHGTSAACPMAAGLVALLLTGDPNLTYAHIVDIFKNTAEKINSDEYSYINGRADEVG